MQQDLERFKAFIAGCRLDELHERTGVPVLGRMGSSKSTTIAIQLGAIKKLEVTEDGRNTFKTVKSETFCPQASDGWISKTLNVGCYETKDKDFTYIDTAGLNENRGPDEVLWTTWSTSMMFQLLERIPALLVCIDFAETFSTRAPAVRELAECLRNIIGSGQSSQPLYDSMVFVFSNPWRPGSSQRVTVEQVVKTASAVRQAEHGKLLRLLQRLARDYGKGSKYMMAATASVVATTAAMVMGETHEALEAAVDWKKVPEQCANEYDKYICAIRLLTTIEEAAGGQRCFLSWPDGTAQSQLQQTTIREMIRRAPGVCKEQLREVVQSRTTNALLVCETLAAMTATPWPALDCSYRDILAKKAKVLRELRDQFTDKGHAALLAHIEKSWEGVRDQLIRQKQEVKDTLETEIHIREKEKRDLMASMKVMPLHVEQIRKARRVTLNPLSWFGLNNTKTRWQYENDVFLHYDLVGSNYEKTEVLCRASEGRLDLQFESAHGHDLSVDVKVMRHEKDLPVTHQRVDVLTEDIHGFRAERKEKESEIMSLQAVQGKTELIDIVLEKNRFLRESLRAVDGKLQGEAGARSEGDVVEALARILSLLQRDSVGLSPDLADGPRQSIVDFTSTHTEVLELKGALEADDIAKNHVSVTSPTSPPMHEDEEPVNCWRYEGHLAVEKVKGFVSSLGDAASSTLGPWLVENRLPISGMLLVLSFYFPWSALLSASLRCAATGILIKAAMKMPDILGSTVLDATGGVNRNMNQLRRDLNHHVDKITSKAGDVVQEAATRVTEKTTVNVEWRAKPMDGILGVAKIVAKMLL